VFLVRVLESVAVRLLVRVFLLLLARYFFEKDVILLGTPAACLEKNPFLMGP
jgi:hypothetical protein